MGYTYLPAVYQTPGRVSIDFIAVHWMATTLAGCDATFTGGQRQASAHYGVENRVIHQYVYDGNTAWALGNWDANQRSISVEHSAGPGRLATDETYETSIALIASKCVEHGLIPSHDTIRPHNHYQATQCPGTMDLDRIINGVQETLNQDEDQMSAQEVKQIIDYVQAAHDVTRAHVIKETVKQVNGMGQAMHDVTRGYLADRVREADDPAVIVDLIPQEIAQLVIDGLSKRLAD